MVRTAGTPRNIDIQLVSRTTELSDLMESLMEDRWLSVDDVATYLGIRRDTIYKWIDRKRMPAHKVGRLWKFRKADIDQWVISGMADESGNEPDVITER